MRIFIFAYLLSFSLTGYSLSKWIFIEPMLEQQKWQDVLQQTEDEVDIEPRCYNTYIKQKLGQEPQEVVPELWLVPYSQPKACDHLFNYWSDNSLLSQEHYQNRFLLSLSADRLNLAKYLAKQIENKLFTEQAFKIYHEPKSTLHRLKNEQSLLAFAVERVAEKYTSTEAELVYEILKQKHTFSTKDKIRVAEVLSIYYAVEDDPKTLYWFKQIPRKQLQTEVIVWQIRYHLRSQHWSKVRTMIQLLPKKNAQQAVWQYWLAQSFKHQGNNKTYLDVLRKTSQLREFYGMIAALEIEQQLPFNQVKKQHTSYQLKSLKQILQPIHEQFKKKKTLAAKQNWFNLLEKLSEHDRYLAAKIALQWQQPELAIKTARTLTDQDYLHIRFPIFYKKNVRQCKNKYDFQPELIYAMIRQESAFQKDAYSNDGALGLLQLLPNTARYIAQKKHLYYKNKKHLLDPQKNIQLGCAYLAYLYQKFNQHYLFALAAYNMGPGNLKKNLPKKNMPLLIWLETLPRPETRHYLKNILTYTLIYQKQMGKKISLDYFFTKTSNLLD